MDERTSHEEESCAIQSGTDVGKSSASKAASCGVRGGISDRDMRSEIILSLLDI